MIDGFQLGRLYTKKDKVSARLKELFDANECFYKEDIVATHDSPSVRQVILIPADKYTEVAKFERCIERLKKVNKEMLEIAPDFFKESQAIFKEPRLIKNVIGVKVYSTPAKSVQTRDGGELERRAYRMIAHYNKKKKLALQNGNSRDVIFCDEKIADLKKDAAMFGANPDKEYRVRGNTHNDPYTLVTIRGEEKPIRLRANAGGLILSLSSKIKRSNIVNLASKKGTPRKSVYDDLVPIKNNLELKGLIYDKEEADRALETFKEPNGKIEGKERPKSDEFVN